MILVFIIYESGKVVMVRTHVNDLKVFSTSQHLLYRTVDELRKIYGEITVHKGDTHYNLGMVMTHNREKQQVKIDVKKYINNCINSSIEEDRDVVKIKQVSTPAAKLSIQNERM